MRRSPSPVVHPQSAEVTERVTLSRRGVSLVELVLTLVLIGMVLGAAVFFIANLARSLQGESASVGGATLSVVPARDQLAAATACQAALLEDAAAATAVFVLGGSYEQDPTTEAPLPTTDSAYVPTSLSGALPLGLQSPGQFRSQLPSGSFASTASNGDYTLFLLDNASTIRAVVQVRLLTADSHVSWSVNYFRGGILQDGSGGTARLSYRFAQTAADYARFTDGPGARHHWLRRSTSWNLEEHLGVRVVLPDPMQSPHADGTGVIVSPRFIHHLPTRKS